MSIDSSQRRIEDFAGDLGSRIGALFTELSELGGRVGEVLATSADLSSMRSMRQQLVALVRRADGFCDGAGVAVMPGTLTDAELWLEWWRVTAGGEEAFHPHSFNTASIGFYDYTEMAWFRNPTQSGVASAVGPYFDGGGTDLRVVTLAVPVNHAGQVSAVVACDLTLPVLERHLVQSIGTEAVVALVTSSGKVIASNSARHFGGTVLTAESIGANFSAQIPDAIVGRLDWRLVEVSR
jgi:hypothetical protein